MKYIHQISIIALVTLMSEILNYMIPLPIPSSIYGLILMFLLLVLKVIRLENIKETGDFLISLMPIMFVAPIVALLDNISSCKNLLLPIILIATVSTVLVMGVTGVVCQGLINLKDKKPDKEVK